MKKMTGVMFFLLAALLLSPFAAHAAARTFGCDPISAPEPATLSLLASGIGALAIFRKTRKNTN